MDDTVGCQAGQFFTGYTFHGFRAPIRTYIREYLCTIGQQVSEQHCYTVTSIVFGSHYECFTNTVPVERSVEQCFRIVTVRIKVCPLALSLEAGSDSIVSQSFFLESHFFQFRVSGHQVTHDDHHLHDKFPISIFLFAVFAFLRAVLEVFSFIYFAVFFSPCHCFGIFFVVIDTFFHAADDFRQVN